MRVWILGAGFSRSLGGPLLTELLSLKARDDLVARYPSSEQVHSYEDAWAVYRLYHYGRGCPEGDYGLNLRSDATGQSIWTDAEHFLDYVDAAKSDASSERRLGDIWRERISLGDQDHMPSIERLSNTARIILAAECCGFMNQHDPSLERWEPYVDWASGLTHDDTVITFNYDTVVEAAAADALAQDGPSRGRGIHVVTLDRAGEGDSPDYNLELDKAKEANMPILLKLHGSVDWEPVPEKRHLPYRRSGNPEYCLTVGYDTRLSLATPGPSKKRSTTEDLFHLWVLADQAIENAAEVNFVGYRFPPSDAQARSFLLGAIARNRLTGIAEKSSSEARRKRLVLRTVLGNDDKGERRLERLLRYAARKSGRGERGSVHGAYMIDCTGLFAEDYLSLVSL